MQSFRTATPRLSFKFNGGGAERIWNVVQFKREGFSSRDNGTVPSLPLWGPLTKVLSHYIAGLGPNEVIRISLFVKA